MLQLEFTEQQPGVTVFGNMQYRAMYIDVKPGITEIHFLPFKMAYYPSEYRLCNVDKTFPDVETIYIADSVACVDIPNQMFPNVKRVISDNKNFETSNILINKTDKTLLNTFCKKPGELIDVNYPHLKKQASEEDNLKIQASSPQALSFPAYPGDTLRHVCKRDPVARQATPVFHR